MNIIYKKARLTTMEKTECFVCEKTLNTINILAFSIDGKKADNKEIRVCMKCYCS